VAHASPVPHPYLVLDPDETGLVREAPGFDHLLGLEG
jgi:hypothetical protein